MAGSLFLPVVLNDDISDGLLEVKRAGLHLGVKLAVDKDAAVEVPLREHAENLVLGHDALVHVADEVEGFVCGVLVAVDFVAHHGFRGADGCEALHEEEVGTGEC